MKILTISNLQNVKEFVRQYGDYAVQVYEKYKLPALVTLAQSALETGWGAHILRIAPDVSSCNMFNIKAGTSWQGKKCMVHVLEYDAKGHPYYTDSYFRAYDSPLDSFLNYGEYITNRKLDDGTLRYQKALDNLSDSYTYITALQEAGYATDPKYAEKIIATSRYFIKAES